MRISKFVFSISVLAATSAISCATKPDLSVVPKTSKERAAVNQEIAMSHRVEVQHCTRIASEETRSGKMKAGFIWDISGDGNVKAVSFDEKRTDTSDVEMLDCVKNVSKDWKFAKGDGDTKVRISYTWY